MEHGDTKDLLVARLTSRADGITVLELVGEIDISSAEVLTDQLSVISSQNLSNVIIDATQVGFMDSTGLHALVEGKRMMHEHGTKIILVPSRQVRRVLELVFPDHLFAVRVDTMDEALALLGTSQEDLPAD